MRFLTMALLIGLTVSMATSTLAAKKTTLKLATLAPVGTTWDKILKEMTAEWNELSEGRVQVKVYAGGVAGDDRDIVRKMRIGQIHAAALTISGLVAIDPACDVFSIPMFYDSYDEFFYVREQITPVLRDRLQEKGFYLVHWGLVGWVHVFTTRSVETVDDLRQIKIFTWAGDDSMTRLWKDNGFNPVALAVPDMLMGLQTGMIDGVPTTPYAALSMQYYRHMPYMLDVKMAPMVGATVIHESGWKRLSEADRAMILESGQGAQDRVSLEIPPKDIESIEEMRKRGLTIVDPGQSDTAEWQATAQRFADKMRELKVPQEIFDMAVEYRTTFRERGTVEAER